MNPWPEAMVVVPLVLVNCPRPKYPVPLAVMLVVLAPPDIVKSPAVMVDDALERKPLVNVARPVCVGVPERVVLPLTVRTPRVASWEKRLVELAVVAKLVVEVALVVVLLSPVKLARVDEALETKPLLKYQERFVVSVVLAV